MSDKFTNNVADNSGKVRRFKHQPITGNHNGVNYSIQGNGRVIVKKDGKEIEFPASLIFKLRTLLLATRETEWVDIASAPKEEE